MPPSAVFLRISLIAVGLLLNASADESAVDDDCGCDKSAQAQQGRHIIGTVESVSEDSGLVTILHKGVPGLLKPGSAEFVIDAAVRARLKPGDRILAQTTPLNDGKWELHAVRLLKPVATP